MKSRETADPQKEQRIPLFLLGGLLVLILLAAGGYYLFRSMPLGGKPNILFIAVDDLRPELGCYGSTYIHSPHMDQLASESVLFERAYCQVPICGGSRASLITGLMPTRNRFVTYDAKVDEEAGGVPTLPAWFKAHGYTTWANGKVLHLQWDARESWSREVYRVVKPHWDYQEYRAQHRNRNGYVSGVPWEKGDGQDDLYADGRLAEKTVKDIRKLANQREPFFLAVGFWKPHLPFNAPEKYWQLYDRDQISLAPNPFSPEGVPEVALNPYAGVRRFKGVPKEGPLPDTLARSLKHGYYACISYVDAQIGKLIEELKEQDLYDNTIIVLWGDHGFQLGEHGMWSKVCNFDQALRVPLLIKPAKVEIEGRKVAEPVQLVDLYPTLCELTVLPQPDHLHGKSLIPLAVPHPDTDTLRAFARYLDGESLITGRYAFTQFVDTNGTPYAEMLYDHHLDPQENVNVAGDTNYRQLLTGFREELAAYRSLE